MEKVLVINNENDLHKFYKKIWLYRSFICNFVTFKIEEDKYDISDLVWALNIKKRRNRLEFIYDVACDEIDEYVKDKNICGFKNNQCAMQRKLKKGYVNGCCRKCVYQSSKGCLTKNLACKFFNCSEVKKRIKVLTPEDLPILRVMFIRQRFIVKSDLFSTRDEIINDLYLNSFIIATLRISWRLIRNNILWRKKRQS